MTLAERVGNVYKHLTKSTSAHGSIEWLRKRSGIDVQRSAFSEWVLYDRIPPARTEAFYAALDAAEDEATELLTAQIKELRG